VSGTSGVSPTRVGAGAVLAQGWWLVRDQGYERPSVVAGPFPDRAAADWTALSYGLDGTGAVRALYGACRPDGTLARRTSPQELAWLAHLGEQLDRLGDDWDEVLSDTDPLTTLVVELTAALVEAGLAVHDCAGRSLEGAAEAGGVCLTPAPARSGVVVSWRQHDRMSVEQVRGAAADAAVQELMNGAVAGILETFGYPVEPLAGGTGSLVRCAPEAC
jgi:hypothetical protein